MLALLLKELSRSSAYPHDVESIRVVQTHISCVFLTGSFAYKIKKPVRFAFVDYSALEKRHEMCAKEVELNRRLCPSVYLDVVPVTEQDGVIHISGAGRTIEWAVRMKQLPESEMLSERLKHDNITDSEIQKIANVIANFHLRATAGPSIGRFGTTEMISRNIEENFQETESVNNEILPDSELHAIEKFSRRFIQQQSVLFQKRIDGNWIREGHGDLRAQNICLATGLDEGVQIFDCIEFSDRLRCLDVLADIAYLATDLDLAGRSDLRHSLIKTYAQKIPAGSAGILPAGRAGQSVRQAGWKPPLPVQDAQGDLSDLLRFYCCYRAYVRGKIALFATEEKEIPEQDRAMHAKTGAAAFDLSTSYADTTQTNPLVCMMVGFSGSGKSALAQELAKRLPAVLLSSDLIRKRLARMPPLERLSNDWYTPEKIAEVYERMRVQTRDWLAAGENVILDATFLSAEERTKTAQVNSEGQARLWIIECECNDSLIRRRLEGRGKDVSDANVAVYESQLQYWQPIKEAGTLEIAEQHLKINTERNPELLAGEILQQFRANLLID